MPYDSGLAERMRDILPRLGARAVREKNVFGGRGFLVGKSAFLIVWDEGIIVKMAPAEYQAALGMRGVVPFAPMGEKPMSTWVVVDAAEVADDPELLEWAERGLRGVATAPTKPPRGRV
jgi:TfoX/Sxy family transcriptional regulator of competence genes